MVVHIVVHSSTVTHPFFIQRPQSTTQFSVNIPDTDPNIFIPIATSFLQNSPTQPSHLPTILHHLRPLYHPFPPKLTSPHHPCTRGFAHTTLGVLHLVVVLALLDVLRTQALLAASWEGSRDVEEGGKGWGLSGGDAWEALCTCTDMVGHVMEGVNGYDKCFGDEDEVVVPAVKAWLASLLIGQHLRAVHEMVQSLPCNDRFVHLVTQLSNTSIRHKLTSPNSGGD